MTTASTIATEYARAWLAGDAEKALSFIADDIVCEAPSGRITGAEGYRNFLTPFVTALVSGELIDVLADEEHAATVYVVETPFAKDFRGMEYITVKDGKIAHVVSVFDRAPALAAKG
ncbi:nuclear transport factor 2 family protein [Kutzneria buriramensis]|uniref:Putative ester cyclase n=1 Tax=Kutzneria buriramensis TaxID=1045776 RepID=A0A3E0H7W0_9PSEU|nr:nuclear transport factor 2 family protein [Kutzneria buriramensis]REH39204.1 putative ester cyclase [Kutzneria buriramensis]